MSQQGTDDSGHAGRPMTDAQRAGVRRTVAIIVVFVIAVFAWTIIGKLIH